MRPRWQIILSILICLHVAAVFLGPWGMAPYDSALSGLLERAMHPYIRALSLDNGYRFFAPEPGPSHLVRYVATSSDGTEHEGIFPNRDTHWPRLLYHRHFMLAEFVNTLDTFAEAPDGPSHIRDACVKSYARHLAAQHDADKVAIYLRRHLIPLPQQVLEGTRLDDSRLYEEKSLGEFTREEL